MTLLKRLAAGSAAGVLGLALTASAVHAQQTTASIRGVVANETGAPQAGVTVTVLHGPTGARAVAMTDATGVFDVQGLRAGGPYTVTASAPGREGQKFEDLYLTVGDAQRLKLVVKPANAVEEVVVTAAPAAGSAQLANVGSRTTLRREDIETVVSVKRDLRDIGRRDPLASLDFISRSTGPSGGLYIAGSSPRSNRITIDGVRSQDDYGINTGGLSTNRGPVSLEALEQVSIQAVPFDVEEGDFTGGALNLILRSGGNTFHGSAFDYYRTGRLVGNELPIVGFIGGDVTRPVADNTFVKVKNKIHESNFGFFLSGPILPDRLFFAASYEKFSSLDLTGTGPLGAGFANIFNPIPGISTGSGATQSDIDRVLANYSGYAASSALAPGSVALTKPILDEKYSAKIDYVITDNQRLSATYRHAFSSVWKRSPSTTSISLDTNWYVQPENEDTYSLQLNSKWSDRLSTEARIAYRGYQRGQQPPEGQGFVNLSICTDPTSLGATFSCTGGVPALNIGPDQFRQANVLKTKGSSGSFIARYRLGDDHLIKAGYQYRGIEVYNLFVQQARGVYYFDSVADFAAGRANQYSIGGALSGNVTDAAAKFSYDINTLLVQDTWDITDQLTLNYGVRYDRYSGDEKPTLNSNFVTRYGFSNQTTYDGFDILMPRISAKYRAESFEVSGGVGLVSGGVPDVFLGNSFGATTGALSNSFSIRRQQDGTFFDTASSTVVPTATGLALLNLNKADASFISGPGAAAQALLVADSAARRNAFTNSLAPGFDLPSDWKANVSFGTQLAGFDLRFDAVATQSRTNVAFRDIRARLLTVNGVQQLTPDGRIRYDGLQIPGATPQAVSAARAAAGLPVATNPDLANLGLFGDVQAYNPGRKSWTRTAAFSVARTFYGVTADASWTIQDGRQYGGISEFGTTAGGNATAGAFYPDQTFDLDPNATSKGKSGNVIRSAYKLNLSYEKEWRPGWLSRFTLFGEQRTGRPISFLMTDPAGNRNPTFGVSRDDALVYVPNLGSPDPSNPLKFASGGTTVFFDSALSLQRFTALVNKFGLPSGRIVPRGFGRNPDLNRIDFQYAQDIPLWGGQKVQFTADIANLGNLLNKRWGVVKEYTNSRAGGVVVNAQCADANGVLAGAASPVCASYRYSYTTVSAATLATPTVDQTASLWSLVLGIKYKF